MAIKPIGTSYVVKTLWMVPEGEKKSIDLSRYADPKSGYFKPKDLFWNERRWHEVMPTAEIRKPQVKQETDEDKKEQEKIEKEFQKALSTLDKYREDPEFFEDLMNYWK